MKSKSLKKVSLSDANLLLTITIVVFFLMYIGAMIFEGGGFLKPQTFFNILNANGKCNQERYKHISALEIQIYRAAHTYKCNDTAD